MPLPSSLLAADRQALLKHVGSAVVWRGARVFGKLHTEEVWLVDERGLAHPQYQTTLTIDPADRPSAGVEDDTLTVDGVSYTVRHIGRVRPDGFQVITLAEVT